MSRNLRINLIVLAIAGLLVAGLPMTVMAQSATGGPQAAVTVQALNVRAGPGTSYAIVGSLHLGDQVTLNGRDATGGWYQVQLGAGGSGWINGSPAYVQVSGDASGLPVAQAAAAVAPAAVAPAATSSTPSAAGRQGHTIVFQISSGGAIYILNQDGSNLHVLTNGIDPALSPDAQWVAFTRWENGNGNGALGSLWVINVNGSGERKVLGDVRQPKSPTWSADGATLVISMQQGGVMIDTYSCIVNGKLEKDLRQPIAGARCFLVPANPNWGLRRVNVATGAFEDLPHAAHSTGPTWDPVNAWHVVYHGDQGLMSLDLNQGTSWQVTSDPNDHTPAFSPDGSKIAVSYWQNDHWEVHAMNADGGSAARLTETPLQYTVNQQIQGLDTRSWNNAAPAWSPDGSQIAFVTDRSGAWEIWVMNADGSNQRPLVPASALSGAKIQYDGNDERVISWR